MNKEILEAVKKFASEVSSFANNVAYYAENEEQIGHARDMERAADRLVEAIESGLTPLAPDVCSACKGSGIDPNDENLYCEPCGGMGRSNAGKA